MSHLIYPQGTSHPLLPKSQRITGEIRPVPRGCSNAGISASSTGAVNVPLRPAIPTVMPAEKREKGDRSIPAVNPVSPKANYDSPTAENAPQWLWRQFPGQAHCLHPCRKTGPPDPKRSKRFIAQCNRNEGQSCCTLTGDSIEMEE